MPSSGGAGSFIGGSQPAQICSALLQMYICCCCEQVRQYNLISVLGDQAGKGGKGGADGSHMSREGLTLGEWLLRISHRWSVGAQASGCVRSTCVALCAHRENRGYAPPAGSQLQLLSLRH
jgi:hypothetical protein